VVSRYRYADCIPLVEPFVRLHEVENPLLEVIKHANVHCMEEVRLQEVAHDKGDMSKHIESSGDMVPEGSASAAMVLASLSVQSRFSSHRGCCLSEET
jgi:hypothetical protein